MMNIGNNPTTGNNDQTIEVHFFNLNQDLYGLNLKITILESVRDEQKFESLLYLKEQLQKDKAFSISFLKNNETTAI
jgi:riboflavin kinase/FMN adenylyltransferase